MALHNRKCWQGEALENVTINTQPLQKPVSLYYILTIKTALHKFLPLSEQI